GAASAGCGEYVGGDAGTCITGFAGGVICSEPEDAASAAEGVGGAEERGALGTVRPGIAGWTGVNVGPHEIPLDPVAEGVDAAGAVDAAPGTTMGGVAGDAGTTVVAGAGAVVVDEAGAADDDAAAGGGAAVEAASEAGTRMRSSR